MTAEEYRKEWATLSGRPESDIYVPEALREASDSETAERPSDSENRGA